MSVLNPTQIDTSTTRVFSASTPLPSLCVSTKPLDTPCFEQLLSLLPRPFGLFRPKVSRIELEHTLSAARIYFDRTSCQMCSSTESSETEQRTYQEAPPSTTTFSATYQRGICVSASTMQSLTSTDQATNSYQKLRKTIAQHLPFLKAIEPLHRPNTPCTPPQHISWLLKCPRHTLILSLSVNTDNQVICTLATTA